MIAHPQPRPRPARVPHDRRSRTALRRDVQRLQHAVLLLLAQRGYQPEDATHLVYSHNPDNYSLVAVR